MNKIHTPITNPQDETTTPKQEAVIGTTWSAIEQSLSQAPLTTDEKINQLTDQVRNINNGLNELIELSKILIKWQIENANSMGVFIHSMEKSTQSTEVKLTSIEASLNTKITNAVKEIVNVQQESNKKNLSNQKRLANWLQMFADKVIEHDRYDNGYKYKCLSNFNSVEQ